MLDIPALSDMDFLAADVAEATGTVEDADALELGERATRHANPLGMRGELSPAPRRAISALMKDQTSPV